MSSTVLEPAEASIVTIVDPLDTSSITEIVSTSSDSQSYNMRTPPASPSHKSHEEKHLNADELEDSHPQTYGFDVLSSDFPTWDLYTSRLDAEPEFTETDLSPNFVLTPTTSSSDLHDINRDEVSLRAMSFSNMNLSAPVSQLCYSDPRTGTLYTYPRTISESELYNDTDTLLNQNTSKARTMPSPSENEFTHPYPKPHTTKTTNVTCHAQHSHGKTSALTTPNEDKETHNTNPALQIWLMSMDNEDIPTGERLLQSQWHDARVS